MAVSFQEIDKSLLGHPLPRNVGDVTPYDVSNYRSSKRPKDLTLLKITDRSLRAGGKGDDRG